jgi:hypothetical protein
MMAMYMEGGKREEARCVRCEAAGAVLSCGDGALNSKKGLTSVIWHRLKVTPRHRRGRHASYAKPKVEVTWWHIVPAIQTCPALKFLFSYVYLQFITHIIITLT